MQIVVNFTEICFFPPRPPQKRDGCRTDFLCLRNLPVFLPRQKILIQNSTSVKNQWTRIETFHESIIPGSRLKTSIYSFDKLGPIRSPWTDPFIYSFIYLFIHWLFFSKLIIPWPLPPPSPIPNRGFISPVAMPGVPSATDKIEKPVRDRNCPRTTFWKFDVSSIFTRFVQQAGGGGGGGVGW